MVVIAERGHAMVEALHSANQSLMDEIERRARRAGLKLAVYRTSSRTGAFAGYARYAAYQGAKRPFGIRSRRVVAWEQTPFQRYWRPSIIGEAEALMKLGKTLWHMGLRSRLMAKIMVRATSYKQQSVSTAHRLSNEAGLAEANTWRTLTQAYIRVDGSGYIKVTRDGVLMHEYILEKE